MSYARLADRFPQGAFRCIERRAAVEGVNVRNCQEFVVNFSYLPHRVQRGMALVEF